MWMPHVMTSRVMLAMNRTVEMIIPALSVLRSSIKYDELQNMTQRVVIIRESVPEFFFIRMLLYFADRSTLLLMMECAGTCLGSCIVNFI